MGDEDVKNAYVYGTAFGGSLDALGFEDEIDIRNAPAWEWYGTSAAIRFNPDAPSRTGLFPSGNWSVVWAKAASNVPEGAGDVQRTYLIVATSKALGPDPVTGTTGSDVTKVGKVTFTIKQGDDESTETLAFDPGQIDPSWLQSPGDGTLVLKPQHQAGRENSIRLMDVNLAVDYDRDGEDDILSDEGDIIPENKLYRFWTNVDNDEGDDANAEDQLINYQVLPNNSSDLKDNVIDCLRDLEDFTRLHLKLGSLADLNQIEIGLKSVDIKDPDSPPSIRVFLSADEEHGTDDYLFDLSAANAQVHGESIHSSSLVTVGQTTAYLPDGTLNHASSKGLLHMIFEGVTPGKGTLALEIKENGNSVEVVS